MANTRASPYLCRPLAELARQLVLAKGDRVHEYVRRAERLHDQIDSQAAYPIDFLAYRITGQRLLVDSDEDSPLLTGQAVLADLRQLIDEVSYTHPLPMQDDEAVEVADDLAVRLNVSTKTLSRWRKAGLRWRWMTTADFGLRTSDFGELSRAASSVEPRAQSSRAISRVAGQRQLAFTREAIERFTAANPQRIERASKFTQMSGDDRARLIERARRIALARSGVSLNHVATHLARRSGRAVETIRLLLEQHDAQHDEDRIFADHTGPLSARQRRVIARAYRMGIPVSKIARHFKRAHSTIYRAIQDRRASVVRRLPISFVLSKTFGREDAEAVILRHHEDTPGESPPTSAAPVHDLPAELQPLYRQPTLDHASQQSLFVRFNFLKFKAAQLRDGLDKYEPRASDLDRIEAWLKEAAAVRDRLVLANLPLVLSVARRHLLGQAATNQALLVELLEVGNQVLIEAIDAYDFVRDRTFEAYLTFVLMRRFASSHMGPRRAHRRLSGDEALRRLKAKAGESGVMLALDEEHENAKTQER